MVPAESIWNLEERFLFLTKSVKTPSAAGLLHIFPKHTNKTENGFSAIFSVWVVEAIDDVIMVMGFCWVFNLWRKRLELWKNGYWFRGRNVARNGGLEGQNGNNLGVVGRLLVCSDLITWWVDDLSLGERKVVSWNITHKS